VFVVKTKAGDVRVAGGHWRIAKTGVMRVPAIEAALEGQLGRQPRLDGIQISANGLLSDIHGNVGLPRQI